jgi:hypothetical protein
MTYRLSNHSGLDKQNGVHEQGESLRYLHLALPSRLQWSIVAAIWETGSVVKRSTSHVSQEGNSW